MATLTSVDLSAVKPGCKTRKIQMQTDAAEKIRLILLPLAQRFKLTVGPTTDSAGALSTARVSFAVGPASTFSNNASGTAIADGAARCDLHIGEWAEITAPIVADQRPAELAIWSDSTSAYVEVTLDGVE